MGVEPVLSSAYSLFVVGCSASIGAVNRYRHKQLSLLTAVYFGLPSVAAIFLTRRILVPKIPDVLFTIGQTSFSKGAGVLVLFAILMVFSAVRMIRSGNGKIVEIDEKPVSYLLLGFQGAFVGLLTGLVGAGGGFLIVPALVFIARLPMKKAAGTSLFIIACNSLVGFTGDVAARTIEWSMLLPFTLIAVAGIFVGFAFVNRVNSAQLKVGFGYFILLIAAWIFANELLDFV